MPAHHCHAEECSAPVEPRMFSCPRHWRMVPRWLQKALWAVYREGQEVDKRPSAIYLVVQTRCRIEIARAESRFALLPRLCKELRQDIGHAFPEWAQSVLLLPDEGLLRWVDSNLGGPR